jgi:hypothetical protein
MRKIIPAAAFGCCLLAASAAFAQYIEGPALIPVAPYPYVPPPVIIQNEAAPAPAEAAPVQTRQEILDQEMPQQGMTAESAMPGGSVMQRSMAIGLQGTTTATRPAQGATAGAVQEMQSDLRFLREEVRLLNALIGQLQPAEEAAPRTR